MTKIENEWTMRELTADEVRDLVCNDEPEADDLLDWAVAHEIEGERRRWSTRVTTILMTPHGEYLAVEWDRANTESGDHEFWEQVPTPVQRSAVTSYKGTTKTSVTYEWTPLAGTNDAVRQALREDKSMTSERECAKSRRPGQSLEQAQVGLGWYGELTLCDREARRPGTHRMDICEVKVVRTADELNRLWADGWRPL